MEQRLLDRTPAHLKPVIIYYTVLVGFLPRIVVFLGSFTS